MSKKNRTRVKKPIEQAVEPEVAPVVETVEVPAPATDSPMSASAFVKVSNRQHHTRTTSTKYIRQLAEVDFLDSFTMQFINGDIPDTDIKILADVKAYLKQLDNNPFNLKDNEANAFVCTDCHGLCITGIVKNDVRVKMQAKAIGSRVAYFNPILAQEMINSESDDQKKAEMEARFEKLKSFPNKEGYGLPVQ